MPAAAVGKDLLLMRAAEVCICCESEWQRANRMDRDEVYVFMFGFICDICDHTRPQALVTTI